MTLSVASVILQGEGVRMEPLSLEHAHGLYNRGRCAADWALLPRSCFVDLADTRQWIAEALVAPAQIPFAIIETKKDRVVGSTRYLNIREEHHSLEIGWTWLGQDWQRTGINTEAKLLLLTHAFERLGCQRVEFKTDARNVRSQQALERMGARREGVLRKHMITQGNHQRDSVYYSVIDDEWLAVRERLTQLRDRYA